MRERYGARRAALEADVERYLGGVLRLPEIQAGLSTPAYLRGGIAASDVIERGSRRDLDLWSLDRYALQRRDLSGLLLGFAAFTEREIRDAVIALAGAVEEARGGAGRR
jgi:GntR family transcriptional regulator/MocR family aminotransferase